VSEPWFDGNMWGWLPGTAFGVLGGLWGSLTGILAHRGKGQGIVRGGYFLLLAAGTTMLVAGIYAAATGQPYGVWYSLMLPGVLTVLVIFPLGFVARSAARRAEERKMRAQELE
jgi:peptidoglycan/LPS O-acetylase OafA/YrhL